MFRLSDPMKRALVVCAGVCCAHAAAQQPATKPADPPANEKQPEKPVVEKPAEAPPERPIEWIIKTPNELGFAAGFVDKIGDVAVSRVGADLEVDIPVGPMGELDIGFAYEYSRYDFSNATSLVPGSSSPWQNIHKETLRASFGKQQTRQLGWIVGGSVGLSAEEGADLGKAVAGGMYAGVGYYLSEHLKVGMAVAVYSQLEDHPLILPVPSFKWEISDQWLLSTAGKPGLTMFYKPSDEWTLSLGAWYESRNFRLDKTGVVPDGVGRDSSVPVEFDVMFKPTKSLSVEAGVGVRLLQSFSVDGSSGNTLVRVDGDAAPFLTCRFAFSF